MVKTVSVKDVRLKFGSIRKELAKGTNFIVIYRSMPICKMSPLDNDLLLESKKNIFKKWPSFSLPLKNTAVNLIRKERE